MISPISQRRDVEPALHEPTVQGFGSRGVAKITNMDEVTIVFEGSVPTWQVHGSVDRVTGDAEATTFLFDQKQSNILLQLNYSLKCKPTQRMF
jgi:hypothetical protein